MTTSTKTRKATKTVKVLSRIEFNADARKVVYIVRSSNGADTYQTTLFAGKATSCTCPSHKPCYHMMGCETLESARSPFATTPVLGPCATCAGNHSTYRHDWAMLSMDERQAAIDAETVTPVSTYQPMTREQYSDFFDVCGLDLL